MRIGVTGAAGYVGSILCRDLLDNHFDVKGMDNFHTGTPDSILPLFSNPQFEFQRGDVTDHEKMGDFVADCDLVIHLAAIVGFPMCAAAKETSGIVNTNGTWVIAEACKKHGARMIFASTGSVYGKVDGICTEDSPLNAVSYYGLTKIAAENAMFSVLPDSSVALRFATGFGLSPNMRASLLVNNLTLEALTNKTISVFQADAGRTFLHVRDISSSYVWTIENFDKMKSGRVYNVGNDNLNMTKRELATIISETTGCFVHFEETGVDADLRDYKVSHEKIGKTGWHARIGLRDGINEMVRAFGALQHKYHHE